MRTAEAEGKTIEEAKAKALEELGIDESAAKVTVIAEPSAGFLGIFGGHAAKVRVTDMGADDAAKVESVPDEKAAEVPRKEAPRSVSYEEGSPIRKGEAFLQDVLRTMNVTATTEAKEENDRTVIRMHGDDMGVLIGKHGQTLDALQYLVNLAANHGLGEEDAKAHIILDVEDYRARREETLKTLAQHLAEKACRTGQKVNLEPMNRHERKVIHTTLESDERVMTYSAGDEPYRRVVIEPKHKRHRSQHRSMRRQRHVDLSSDQSYDIKAEDGAMALATEKPAKKHRSVRRDNHSKHEDAPQEPKKSGVISVRSFGQGFKTPEGFSDTADDAKPEITNGGYGEAFSSDK